MSDSVLCLGQLPRPGCVGAFRWRLGWKGREFRFRFCAGVGNRNCVRAYAVACEGRHELWAAVVVNFGRCSLLWGSLNAALSGTSSGSGGKRWRSSCVANSLATMCVSGNRRAVASAE